MALGPVLWWAGLLGVGVAVSLLVYLATAVRVPRKESFAALQSRWRLLQEEPVLTQVWRFVRVVVTSPFMSRMTGSAPGLDPDRLNNLVLEAGRPWGLASAIDVYAAGSALSVGTMLAILYLSGFDPLALTALPAALGIGFAIPVVALSLTANRVRQAKVLELWTMINALELYLKNRQGLYQALKEASFACDLIRPQVERALLQWSTRGAEEALTELAKDLQLPEAYVVVAALRQAVQQDPAFLSVFMARESIRLEQYLRARQEEANQYKPMLLKALHVLPAVNIFLLVGGSWTYALMKKLEGNNLF